MYKGTTHSLHSLKLTYSNQFLFKYQEKYSLKHFKLNQSILPFKLFFLNIVSLKLD